MKKAEPETTLTDAELRAALRQRVSSGAIPRNKLAVRSFINDVLGPHRTRPFSGPMRSFAETILEEHPLPESED